MVVWNLKKRQSSFDSHRLEFERVPATINRVIRIPSKIKLEARIKAEREPSSMSHVASGRKDCGTDLDQTRWRSARLTAPPWEPPRVTRYNNLLCRA
jgi:hypothetical protein